MNNPPDLIGVGEAAAILGVHRSTVSLWADNGDLPTAMFTVGGQRRFNRSDVEALRDQLMARGTAS
jgi:excisionase family DNA binding protein